MRLVCDCQAGRESQPQARMRWCRFVCVAEVWFLQLGGQVREAGGGGFRSGTVGMARGPGDAFGGCLGAGRELAAW